MTTHGLTDGPTSNQLQVDGLAFFEQPEGPVWQRAAGVAPSLGRPLVELLAAAAGAVGPRFGPVVRVRAAGLRGRLLQPL